MVVLLVYLPMNRDEAKKRLDDIVERNVFNWSKAAQDDGELRSFILDQTGEHEDRPFKERAWIAVTGDGPECPHGRTRKFKDIITGWSFCEKSKACVCLADHKSRTIRESKAKARSRRATVAAETVVTLTDEDAVTRIRAAAIAEPKRFSQGVQNDPELFAWVMVRSAAVPDVASFAERCYVAIHGPDVATCPKGQRRTFYSFKDGYEGSCDLGSHCACRREQQARTMAAHHASLDDAERERRRHAVASTNLARYGHTSVLGVPAVREKIRRTIQDRFGADHHMRSETGRASYREKFRARWGADSPFHMPQTHEKVRETNLRRYGASTTMAIARDAYRKQTGLQNPFQNEDVKRKADTTMMERHGVRRALQSAAIRHRMTERMRQTHGVTHPMMLQSVRDRLRQTVRERYNRDFVNQDHIPDEVYAILQDAERFSALVLGSSLREAANTLGIAYDTARKYCYRHGVILPKSSYETSIVEFLRGIGVTNIRQGVRDIIPPREIDIVLPDHKIGIEFCGLYWHRHEHIGDKNYHKTKTDAMEHLGYRLITIFEDEWLEKPEIVRARLRHAVGRSERGHGARECSIMTITAQHARAFLETHHIQGGGVYGFANYGAFHDDALVAVMTFARARGALGSKRTGPVELLRFATDGASHPGVADRLFRRFVRDHQPDSIISYADRRWSNGNLYEKLGFRLKHATDPNYWYCNFNSLRRHHRYLFRKDRVVDRVEDGASKTEGQIMQELGYHRIYDCGSLRYEWSLPRT